MNKGNKETISIRVISTAFMVSAIAIFKPFSLEMWQWQAYGHLLCIFLLGLFSCFLTEISLRYVVRMPHSYDYGVSYIISRNLRFQCINTPLISLFICLYRHFVLRTSVSSLGMSSMAESNKLSLGNYLETLLIIAFLSFAIGLYWRFKFRSRFLAAELDETRMLNNQLKNIQAHLNHTNGRTVTTPCSVESKSSCNQSSHPFEDLDEVLTITGTTNEHVNLKISDLLYLESVGNYVKVVSKRDNNDVLTNMLRSTMKQMEDTLHAYPMIVRCHRAFMVNICQVEKISSNSRAMQLVMRYSHDAIPVSRSHVNKLKELLR